MANIDLSTLLTQSAYGGLPRELALATLQSLSNKLYTEPHNAVQIRSQIQEIFGPDITQQVMNDALPTINQNPVSVQSGPTTPTNYSVQDLLNMDDNAAANNTIIPNLVTNPGLNTPGSLSSLPSSPGITEGINQQGGFFQSGKNNPAYGDVDVDIQRILAEAELQKNLSHQTLDAQKTQRQSYLTDLGRILEEQQTRQLSSELPGVYEDLNTRGLLRSSALGNSLAQRQADLARETSSQLARQGLAYSDEYTSGLGNIQNSYLGARNSALARRFSLQDLDTNIKASKDLGFALQPQPQSNGKGNTLAGTSVGAQVGSAFGPMGTVMGGLIGGGSSKDK